MQVTRDIRALVVATGAGEVSSPAASVAENVYKWAFGCDPDESEGFETASLKGIATLQYLSEFSGTEVTLN